MECQTPLVHVLLAIFILPARTGEYRHIAKFFSKQLGIEHHILQVEWRHWLGHELRKL